jgi:hypothetical protein
MMKLLSSGVQEFRNISIQDRRHGTVELKVSCKEGRGRDESIAVRLIGIGNV